MGQFAADEEFITNQYSAKFINSDFGFPALPANDLPSGGPAYPLATPGVRIKLQPTSSFTVLAAVFNGDPAGPTKGDPQELNASGTSFRTQDGTFSLIEAQYTTDPTDAAQPAPLASTYRLGAWLHSQSFSDQRRDANGVSLASPASTGTGKRRSRDYSLYASVDQRLWSDPRAHAADPKDNGLNRGIGAFARIMGSPDDRNLIDLAVSAGLIWIGAFEDRPADTIGLGVNYARIGRRARALDADMIAAGASTGPVRDSETVVEINYAAQFDWLLLQPSLQYVIHPGGGIANPARPGHVIGDALVLGVRAGITF